jgi:predicted enzyme related to lactoylglutathione lyase
MRSRIWLCLALALSFALGTGFERARAALQHDDEVRVTGIGGVFFKARDPEVLAAWYKQHLGIALESAGGRPSAPSFHSFQWVEKDDARKPGATVLAIFPQKSTYFGPSSALFMIDFRVTNLDRTLAKLKAEGVAVESKIDEESNGRFGWATDAEGNRFELWEPR